MNPPSIHARLSRILVLAGLVGMVVVAAVIWQGVRHEVDELLDDALVAAGTALHALLEDEGAQALSDSRIVPNRSMPPGSERFAWQLVGPGTQVLQRSKLAPAAAFGPAAQRGLFDAKGWRVHGEAFVPGGAIVLFVAQSRLERVEVEADISVRAILALVPLGLISLFILRWFIRRELQPLNVLADRLSEFEPGAAAMPLEPAERAELAPVHYAVDMLRNRVLRRVASERAFSAHAAHSMRTALAGIDAQIAVALRESPPALRPRLQQVRAASAQLERVVTALVTLVRSGAQPTLEQVDLARLMNRLPVEGVVVSVSHGATVLADPDLLAVALLNLLDNAARHGARNVHVSAVRQGSVRMDDDGPGVSLARHQALEGALQRHEDNGSLGIGLMLADQVAQAHGGTLHLPQVLRGFSVELRLQRQLSSNSA